MNYIITYLFNILFKLDIFKNHPELRKGEVFITNSTNGKCCFWETKRVGETAYQRNGKIAKGLVPIFAQRKELVEAGVLSDKTIDI